MRSSSPSMSHLLAMALLMAGHSLLAAAEPEWSEVAIPDVWKKAPAGKDGFLWYRAKVNVPATWRDRKLALVVEAVDDAREFYFGGQKIGGLGDFPPVYRSGLGETKRLAVPGEAIRYGGQNVVAIRVATVESRNGFNVAAPVLIAEGAAIRLAGNWETAGGDDLTWAKADAADIKPEAFSKV